MNQAILKIIEDSKKLHSTPMWIMVTEYFEKQLSSLPSDTQWIDKLEKELEEEDKDIDSLDDYYMGMSVGKSSMLNRVKKEILPNNN